MRQDSFPSDAEQLRANFRAWEVRGRGWQLWPYECRLEPPFRPFVGHHVWHRPFVDDGRRPGRVASFFGGQQPQAPLPDLAELAPEEPDAEVSSSAEDITELHILLPELFEPSRDTATQLLLSLRRCTYPISFELIGYDGRVRLQLACRSPDLPLLRTQLEAAALGLAVRADEDFLPSAWFAVREASLIADLGLSSEFMRPLRGLHSFSGDPLVALVASLTGIEPGELGVIQVLFEAAESPWAESIMRSVLDNQGAPFDLLGRDLAAHAKQKLSSPLFACRVRLGVKAETEERRIQLARGILSSLAQFETPLGNELIALKPEGFDPDAQNEDDLLYRTSHRSGMLLNLDELAALAHLPTSQVQGGLERLTRRTKRAPASLTHSQGVLIGENEHAGESVEVRLPQGQRLQHTYVLGGSGTGKSTFLLSLIKQDIEAGRGVAVLDPHGDLVDGILARMPEARVSDVILLDPSDEHYPIAFNVLEAHSETERTLLSSDLVGVFRRLSTSWGDQMNSIFANAILAFLESSQGGTLLELRHFLVDPKFRAGFLPSVRDPEIVYYWQREFPLLRGNPQAPILTRLDAFLRPKLIRNMVSQKRSALDFRAILDHRQILLCRLSHGAVGEENAYLLGALVVAKIQQMALSRQDTAEAERSPFFLYLDEFQHFVTPSIATLLSGVRKYALGLTLANQNLAQLTNRNAELVDAVLANAGTRICFRLGDQDARSLASGFSFFEATDLQKLGTGEAIARVGGAENDFNLATYRLADVDPAQRTSRTELVLNASRARWATQIESGHQPQTEAPPPVALPSVADNSPSPVAAAPKAPAPPSRPKVSAVEASPGRGGAQHKYLQHLIQRFAEDRGFRAAIEKTVLDGQGAVDVSIERDGLLIACEITVTTATEHEVTNVRKCLRAGYAQVLVVVPSENARKRITGALDEAGLGEARSRVHPVLIEELPLLLDGFTAPEGKTEKVAGYTVSVRYSSPPPDEKAGKLDAIRSAITRSIKRLGGK